MKRKTTDNAINPERERRILAAASELIVRYGYDKTTILDIAEAAGISKGAIYLHFESKEALFEELVYYESENVINRLLTAVDDGTLTVESFFSVYHTMMQITGENPLLRALLTRDRRVLGDLIRRMSDSPIFKMGSGLTRDFVRELQAKGIVRDDISTQHVFYLLGIIRYGVLVIDDYLLPEDQVALNDIGPALSDLLERGLSPEGGGNRAQGKEMLLQWLRIGQQMLAARKQQNASSNRE